jgi:hypothetical protein
VSEIESEGRQQRYVLFIICSNRANTTLDHRRALTLSLIYGGWGQALTFKVKETIFLGKLHGI